MTTSPNAEAFTERCVQLELGLRGDEQFKRAAELRALDRTKAARRVERCGKGERRWTCKRAECPRCMRQREQVRAPIVTKVIAQMAEPSLYLFRRWSYSRDDLEQTIVAFKQALRVLKRRRVFTKTAPSGIGGLEVKLGTNGKCWNVHAHVVIDSYSVDEMAIDKLWRELCAGRGRFSCDRDGNGSERKRVSSIRRTASYITKARDNCPAPGTKPLHVLAAQWDALKKKHRLVAWGQAYRLHREFAAQARQQRRAWTEQQSESWSAPRYVQTAESGTGNPSAA